MGAVITAFELDDVVLEGFPYFRLENNNSVAIDQMQAMQSDSNSAAIDNTPAKIAKTLDRSLIAGKTPTSLDGAHIYRLFRRNELLATSRARERKTQ